MCKRVFVFLLFGLSTIAYGQKDPDLTFQSKFDEYTVRHVVFNSTFVLPEVAKLYEIKRSKYESMLNISVYKDDNGLSIPAKLSGTITNLMQQQKNLVFKEIQEDNATYYLAPVRVANEELLKFDIKITPIGSEESLHVKFSQTVYADE